MATTTTYTIIRDDGLDDGIAGRRFASFDEAYIVLESYYADTCCSDESETYRIVEGTASNGKPPEVE
jgi:hypothetical protein